MCVPLFILLAAFQETGIFHDIQYVKNTTASHLAVMLTILYFKQCINSSHNFVFYTEQN